MMTRRISYGLALLFLLLSAGRAAEIRPGEITLTSPEGWKFSKQSGYIGLVPPGTQSKEFAVLIIDEVQAPGRRASEAMDSYWQTATTAGGGDGKIEGSDEVIAAHGNLRWTWREGVRTNGVANELPTGVAVMYRDPVVEAVYVYAFNSAQWDLHKEGVMALLRSARLSAGASLAGTATTPLPSAATTLPPREASPPPAVYLGMGTRYGLGAGGGTRVMRDSRLIIVLPDGRWRSEFPFRGLNTDLTADQRQFPDAWGHWTENKGVITVTRTNDSVVLSPAEWTRLAAPEGIRIDGAFVREDTRGTWGTTREPELIFHSDGSFEDRTGLLNMIGSLLDFESEPQPVSAKREAVLLQPGVGKYLFNNFTLICRYSDGRIRMRGVYLPPGDDPKNPQRLVIGSYVLVKK